MKNVSVSSILKGVGDALHDIRVKLYPNYLPRGRGTYIARTNNKNVLDIEGVCMEIKKRGNFAGDHKVLAGYVRQYYEEAIFQLCSGFMINSGYYTLYLNIGGVFDSPNASRDMDKHPLGFRVRIGTVLKQLAKVLRIKVEGLAKTDGFIDNFTDVHSGTVNYETTGGRNFIVTGDKIKVTGDDPECGIYFEQIEDGTRIKVKERLTQNTASKIIGIAPVLPPEKSYKVVIVTQFNGSSTSVLKSPKTLISRFNLKVK
jgi:hypothetical protein